MNLKNKVLFSILGITLGIFGGFLIIKGAQISFTFYGQIYSKHIEKPIHDSLVKIASSLNISDSNLAFVFDIWPFSENLKIANSSENSNLIFDFKIEPEELEIKRIGFNKLKDNYPTPDLLSDTFLIFDLETGDTVNLLKNKNIDNSNKVLPIASITKLMTALVALENLPKDDQVYINWESVVVYGEQGSLKEGDLFEVWDLIHVMLLESSNDAAEAIAIHYGRPEFIELMNQKAAEIGMSNTFYADASGLTSTNVSTVSDLAKLSTYIEKNYQIIWDITKLRNYRKDDRIWYTNNRFSTDSNYYGGKNGYIDESKKTLISIFELPIGLNDEIRRVGAVVLFSDDASADMKEIYSYILHNLEYIAK